jgi:NitT/TauT family transport system substrate-binding protein
MASARLLLTACWLALVPGAAFGDATILAQAKEAAAVAKPLQKLTGAYVTSLSYSPLFLALEKGYLRDAGIDLQLQEVRSASDTIAFLGRGDIDVAFGNIGVPLFNAIDRGVDVKVVAGMSAYPKNAATLSPAPIVVRKALADSGEVKSVQDLKGRKVAFNTRGGIIEYLVAGALAQAGLKIADIQVATIPFPDMIVALANGAVDAAVMPEPISTAARDRGVGTVLAPNPVPGALATTILFGKNLLTDAQAPAAKSLLQALRRAANELRSANDIMSDANLQIWSKYTKLPVPLIRKTAPYNFPNDLALDTASLLDQQKYLVESKQIAKPLALDRLIDSRFAIKAQ